MLGAGGAKRKNSASLKLALQREETVVKYVAASRCRAPRSPLSVPVWMCPSSSHLINHVLLLPPLGEGPSSPGRKWAGRAVTLAAGP